MHHDPRLFQVFGEPHLHTAVLNRFKYRNAHREMTDVFFLHAETPKSPRPPTPLLTNVTPTLISPFKTATKGEQMSPGRHADDFDRLSEFEGDQESEKTACL